MAAAAKDIGGKVLAIFFPILAFVVSGFEHCVANMYYIPAGIFAAGNPAYVQKAQELYRLEAEKLADLLGELCGCKPVACYHWKYHWRRCYGRRCVLFICMGRQRDNGNIEM